MSVMSYVSKVSEYLEIGYYLYLSGLDTKKISVLEEAFQASQLHVEDSDLGVESSSIESYYLDNRMSNITYDVNVLEKLVQKLNRCIELKKAFEIDPIDLKENSKESKFFFRVYQRKLEECQKKLVKVNPFPKNTDKYRKWKHATLVTNKPPVFKEFTKEYDDIMIKAMNETYSYLSTELKITKFQSGENNNLFKCFTYVEKKSNDLVIKATKSIAIRASISLIVILILTKLYQK